MLNLVNRYLIYMNYMMKKQDKEKRKKNSQQDY